MTRILQAIGLIGGFLVLWGSLHGAAAHDVPPLVTSATTIAGVVIINMSLALGRVDRPNHRR